MNYEINLLCDDKTRTGNLSGFPLAITGLFIVILVIITLLYAAAYLYADHLNNEVATYEADLNRLTAKILPLAVLEERNLAISLKKDLEAELKPAGQPVSETLRQVNSKLSENLNISSVTVEKSGAVYIIGTGAKMQPIAAYSQSLDNLYFIETVEITEIKLAESGLYYFKLELKPMEESVYDTDQ